MEIYLVTEMIDKDDSLDFYFKAFRSLEDAEGYIKNNLDKNLVDSPVKLELE